MRSPAEIVSLPVSAIAIEKGSRRACDSLFYLKYGQLNITQHLQQIYTATLAEQTLLEWAKSASVPVAKQPPLAFLQREQFPATLNHRRLHLQCIRLDDTFTHPLKQVAALPLKAFVNPSFGEDSIFLFASVTGAAKTAATAIYPTLTNRWRTQPLAPLTLISETETALLVIGKDSNNKKITERVDVKKGVSLALENDFAGITAIRCATVPDLLSLYSTALDDTLTIDPSDWVSLGSHQATVTFWGWLSRAELREKSTLLKEKKQRVIPLLSLRALETLIV